MDSRATFQPDSDHRASDGRDPVLLRGKPHNPTFWRVEGSLLNLTAVRPVGFFAWNAQSFLERWTRRGGMLALAVARPVLYLTNRAMATRLLHTILRGVSRDRLAVLGEEYFTYILKPALKPRGVEELKKAQERGEEIVLVSQGLDHVMRPLAQHLGVKFLISNRLEFRDGMATGRLRDPVIRPRGPLARLTGSAPNGAVSRERLVKNLGFAARPEIIDAAVESAEQPKPKTFLRVVHCKPETNIGELSVREALRGKNILLAGATGFIGKVWLVNLLTDAPEIGKVFVLVRRRKTTTAAQRFRKVVDESPLFEALAQRYGSRFEELLEKHVEVIDGDLSKPGLGLDDATRARLARTLDLVINSSGLTDFNPDLRDALAANVDSAAHLLEFMHATDHAALLHLSTCYVTGERDGRISETLTPNYNPAN